MQVAAGDSLWLPVEVPLAGGGLCNECSAFANGEYIVYATAELQTVEFENGILAMEFAAPQAGEVMLQLSRKPSGPFLAGGKPLDFDWDEKTLRARLPVPAGKGAASRVRIGLAIEAPETSAFFVDAKRLVIGQKNLDLDLLLFRATGGALAPAPAGELHGEARAEIAARNRLRAGCAARRPARDRGSTWVSRRMACRWAARACSSSGRFPCT